LQHRQANKLQLHKTTIVQTTAVEEEHVLIATQESRQAVGPWGAVFQARVLIRAVCLSSAVLVQAPLLQQQLRQTATLAHTTPSTRRCCCRCCREQLLLLLLLLHVPDSGTGISACKPSPSVAKGALGLLQSNTTAAAKTHSATTLQQ
jgi:hypothetical protein